MTGVSRTTVRVVLRELAAALTGLVAQMGTAADLAQDLPALELGVGPLAPRPTNLANAIT